jgi:predicted ATP-grasp superfamily ATP-dependent carboligase
MAGAGQVALDAGVPALVLKVGHYPLHHGGLAAIRSLGRAGVAVYGVHEDRWVPAAVSRYLTGRFVWRNLGRDDDSLLAGMAEIGERIGRRAVIVPTDDAAAVFVAEHAEELRRRFRLAAPAGALPRTLASKLSLYQTCRELGVACPESVVPPDRAAVEAFCRRATFPVVVKTTDWTVIVRAGVRSTRIVATPEALLALWNEVERVCGGGRLLLQEHIPDGEDWIVHGYCDERSECLVGFTGVKLRSYPMQAGLTTLARCRTNEHLLDQATTLFRKLGYQGIMDLDWRLDRRDGQYKLLDFNPRLGAQFRLFETPAGVDVVHALHLDLTGRSVPHGFPPEGRAYMVEFKDAVSALGHRRRRELTLLGWLRSLRGVRELAWFAPDDLLPLVSLLVQLVLERGRKRRRRRVPPSGDGTPTYFRGRWRNRGTAEQGTVR